MFSVELSQEQSICNKYADLTERITTRNTDGFTSNIKYRFIEINFLKRHNVYKLELLFLQIQIAHIFRDKYHKTFYTNNCLLVKYMILVCFEVVTAKVVLLIARNTYSDNVTAKGPERIIMSNDLPNTTSTSQ